MFSCRRGGFVLGAQPKDLRAAQSCVSSSRFVNVPLNRGRASQFSDNTTLKELFTPDDTAPAAPGTKFKSNKFKGVIDTFRVQLQDL